MNNQRVSEDKQNAGKYACGFCEMTFLRKDKLDRHLFLHTGLKSFKCEFENCEKSYTNASHLKRHVRSCHTSKPKINSYICKFRDCMQGFSNVSNMNRHYKQIHFSDPYTCDYCMAKFRRKIQIKRHFKHSHNLGICPYQCNKCNKGYFSKFSYSKHTSTHKTKECGVCHQTFNNWSQLVTHRKLEHKTKKITRFECDLCAKTFCRKPNIKQHIKSHLMKDQVYSCSYENCSKFYTAKRNLVAHIRSKHEGKKFYCHICNIKLSTNQKLQNHIAAHDDPIKSKFIKSKISLLLGIKVHKDVLSELVNSIPAKLDPTISNESEFSDN